MQPEDTPRAAPLVIAVYGQPGDKETLARELALDGYDVRPVREVIVLRRTPRPHAWLGAQHALRGGQLAGSGARILSHGKLHIDTAARVVSFNSEPVVLRPREYELLRHLAQDRRESIPPPSCLATCGATARRV